MLSRQAMQARQVKFFDIQDELINVIDRVNAARDKAAQEGGVYETWAAISAASYAQALDAAAPVDAQRRANALTLLANDIDALTQGRAPTQEVDELDAVFELVEQERIDQTLVKPFTTAIRSRASKARRAASVQSSIQFNNALFDCAHKMRALALLYNVKQQFENVANGTEKKVDSRKHKDALKALLDGNDPQVKERLHYVLANVIRQVLGRLTYGNVCAAITEIENINAR